MYIRDFTRHFVYNTMGTCLSINKILKDSPYVACLKKAVNNKKRENKKRILDVDLTTFSFCNVSITWILSNN